MATEDEINAVYEESLNERSDRELIEQLGKTFEIAHNYKLENYERNQLIRIVLNLDYTGKFDVNFEDLRKLITTNDSCG